MQPYYLCLLLLVAPKVQLEIFAEFCSKPGTLSKARTHFQNESFLGRAELLWPSLNWICPQDVMFRRFVIDAINIASTSTLHSQSETLPLVNWKLSSIISRVEGQWGPCTKFEILTWSPFFYQI